MGGFKIGGSIGNWWDKNVADPVEQTVENNTPDWMQQAWKYNPYSVPYAVNTIEGIADAAQQGVSGFSDIMKSLGLSGGSSYDTALDQQRLEETRQLLKQLMGKQETLGNEALDSQKARTQWGEALFDPLTQKVATTAGYTDPGQTDMLSQIRGAAGANAANDNMLSRVQNMASNYSAPQRWSPSMTQVSPLDQLRFAQQMIGGGQPQSQFGAGNNNPLSQLAGNNQGQGQGQGQGQEQAQVWSRAGVGIKPTMTTPTASTSQNPSVSPSVRRTYDLSNILSKADGNPYESLLSSDPDAMRLVSGLNKGLIATLNTPVTTFKQNNPGAYNSTPYKTTSVGPAVNTNTMGNSTNKIGTGSSTNPIFDYQQPQTQKYGDASVGATNLGQGSVSAPAGYQSWNDYYTKMNNQMSQGMAPTDKYSALGTNNGVMTGTKESPYGAIFDKLANTVIQQPETLTEMPGADLARAKLNETLGNNQAILRRKMAQDYSGGGGLVDSAMNSNNLTNARERSRLEAELSSNLYDLNQSNRNNYIQQMQNLAGIESSLAGQQEGFNQNAFNRAVTAQQLGETSQNNALNRLISAGQYGDTMQNSALQRLISGGQYGMAATQDPNASAYSNMQNVYGNIGSEGAGLAGAYQAAINAAQQQKAQQDAADAQQAQMWASIIGTGVGLGGKALGIW